MGREWSEVIEAAVDLRHTLHRRPELTWKEFATARRIREILSEAGIPWRECASTGTVGTLASGASGRHIALRADIDALPIREEADIPWISEKVGCMHACGHDGHTAALIAAAWWLKRHEEQLPGPVTLLFQPAEEGGHGAKRMIEDGALEGVDAIFGWHNWPSISYGQAVCPDGTVMSANGTFRIEVRGQGGHASQPEKCRDPVLAASAIVMSLQQIVSRRLAPQQAAVVSITTIDAPSTETITPERVTMAGSVRVSEASLWDTVGQQITAIAQSTAVAYDTTAEVALFPRYGVTSNHRDEATQYRAALEVEFGECWRSEDTPTPIMASEDFSYYLNEIPGAFALLGANNGSSFAEPCHSPRYQFNDDLIPHVVRVFSRLVGAPVPP